MHGIGEASPLLRHELSGARCYRSFVVTRTHEGPSNVAGRGERRVLTGCVADAIDGGPRAAGALHLQPGAMTLRYLQTLNDIAAEHNSPIVRYLSIC